MYLRTTQRRNTDGSIVRYVQLAHNHRVDGVTQAEVLVNLGREDRLDREGLRRLVASINRYLGEPDDGGGDVRVEVGDALTVVGSRPMGTVWLLDGLWSQLGVAAALGKVLGQRRFTTDVERVLFALVANRAIDPVSKLAAAEWASNDVSITGLESMDEDQAYRAMDLLIDADTDAQVQEAVFFAVADLLNLEVLEPGTSTVSWPRHSGTKRTVMVRGASTHDYGRGMHGTFPFGRPNVARPPRPSRDAARVLVLGVYPSAFHVRWWSPDSNTSRPTISSLAVDVEPVVFWDGNDLSPHDLLEQWITDVGFTKEWVELHRD